MVTTIVEKPDIIRVSYNDEMKYVLFGWVNFAITLADIQDVHGKALDFAKLKGCKDYVAETSRVKSALSPEVVEWFGSVWVPKLAAYGLKSIITVLPTSALAKLSTNRWQNEVAGMQMANVTSLKEAEELLALRK